MTDLLGDPDPIIRILDFEATSLDDDAEIVEVGYTDLNITTREVGMPFSTLCRVSSMPPEVRAIHHIKASDTLAFPPYDRRCLYEDAVRANVYAWAAHNASYEERFIIGRMPMFCTYKAALRRWPDAPGHSVFSLLYWLEDQGKVTFDQEAAHPPHRAGPDSYATAILLKAILDDGVTGRVLREWSAEPRIFPKCPIGDWRGKPWGDVDYGFLEWILKKIDDPDIRFNAALELEKRNLA